MPRAIFESAILGLNVVDYATTRRNLRASPTGLVYKRHALLDVGTSLAARRHGVPLALKVNVAYSAPSVVAFDPVRLIRLARGAERLALRSATVVVAVSTPLADFLRDLAGQDLPVLVLPKGVNPETFDPARADGAAVRTRYGLKERFVVGWAGVLRRWHGLEVLLDELAGIPAAHLLIIADGPDRTGFASPMKIVEYMDMGLPVVLPRLRNFEDLVEHERTGLFLAPEDAGDLARGLQRLQNDSALRRRLDQAARRAVEQRLNWRSNASALLGEIAARRQAPAA